jgi:hypothetical protein
LRLRSIDGQVNVRNGTPPWTGSGDTAVRRPVAASYNRCAGASDRAAGGRA